MNHHERIVGEVLAAQQRLYWRMISQGWLPSQGWKMCQQTRPVGQFAQATSFWPMSPQGEHRPEVVEVVTSEL